MSSINKIKVGNTEYDIEASSIGDVPSVSVKNTSTAEDAKALVNFQVGLGTGKVGLNSKGNMSIESDTKHVNVEAARAIQMKPTTSIILDTTRRLKNGQDNETVMISKYDDYSNDVQAGTPLSNDEYGYLKFHARAVDLRCFVHGGIALQPCGIDNSGNENKVKFESSRKVSANTIIPANLRRGDSEYGTYYTSEGGKGVEFGTFNNEHTSVFSKDYRFNQDGKVFSVSRGNITVSGDKYDYPSQGDDFKDIPMTNEGNACVWNGNVGAWEMNNPTEGEYILGATWDSIVRTAESFNERSWTETSITKKGNLQISAADEYYWEAVSDPGTEIPNDHVLTNDTPKYSYYADGGIYKLSDESFAVCKRTEHHINLEADSTIKLEVAHNDVELVAGTKVEAKAPVIKLEAIDAVDLSTTPKVSSLCEKVTKKGAFEPIVSKLVVTSLNNMAKSVYENTNENYIRIAPDTLYVSVDSVISVYKPTLVIAKTNVYLDSQATTSPEKDEIFFIKYGGATFVVEINSDHQAKKEPKICNTDHTVLYYKNSGTATILDPTTATAGTAVFMDDTAQTTPAPEGFYLVEGGSSTYILFVSNGQLANFSIIGSSEPVISYEVIDNTYTLSGYDKVTFGGTEGAGVNETEILPGSPLSVGSSECEIKDIITLVKHFKDNNLGPWENQ